MINKLKTTQYYLSDRIEKHSEVKLTLLDLIDQTTDGEYTHEDSNYTHNISKYDFEKHGDMERPWVKFLLPYLLPKLINFVTEFGGAGLFLKALWFQQYKPGDIHDWHIHGENYTGVYYLELPDDTPRTKIYNGEQMIVPEVKEGDLCTPKGIFLIKKLYYRADRIRKPKTSIITKKIYKHMGWCDDPKNKKYNSLINIKEKIKHEKMYRKDSKYDLVLIIN